MKIDIVTKGQIWLLPNLYRQYDMNGKTTPDYHNYIVVSEESSERFGTVQMMEITSLKGREPIHEIPIVLENGYVSYVITANMYSVRKKEILNLGVFKGSLMDNPEIKVYEFVNLLVQMYCSINKFITSDRYNNVLQKEFQNYMEYFNRNFGDCRRYSDMQKPYTSNAISRAEAATDGGENEFSEDNNTSAKRFTKFDTCQKNSKYSDHESTTVYSDCEDAINRVIIPSSILEGISKPHNSNTKIINLSRVCKNDMIAIKQFQSFPLELSKWNDDQIKMWFDCYRRYSASIILKLCPDKFHDVQAIYNFTYRLNKLAKTRKLFV